MILASLFAIALIVVTLLWQQKESQDKQIRAQGLSLAQTLSGVPFEQFVEPLGRQTLLGTIFHSQKDRSFAYATIVDRQNQPVSVAAAPGITVPPMDWPDSAPGWVSERAAVTATGVNIIEFVAPVYADGDIAAYLRLGYVVPGMGISFEQVPFFATLALIIFLLTPLFYLLLRKEIQPLGQANAQMSTVIESEQFRQIELGASEELSDFLGRFTAFVDFAKQRIDKLEHEQEKLVTSKNLITYSKSRIENVLEAIPEGVLILDQSGNVSFANRRIGTILGVTHADVIGSEPSEWCNNAELLNVISRYTGKPEASYLAETTRLKIGDEDQRQLSIKAYPLFSPTDSTSIYGSLIVFRDITRESAIQQQQSEFIAHVAHELKTPLNTLSLCTEALFDDGDDDPQSRIESANIMHDEVERLAGLIDNLLNITKIETGQISVERQRLRLNEFLEDAFAVASRSDRASELTFEIDLPTDVISIMADKELLRIAVNNLLTNAVKYSRPGGLVSMTCEDSEQTVRIIVRDTGIGIEADEQARIFDRFFRSESTEARQRSGHGLGLSLARDIVQLHHGTLTVSSNPGEGSEFVIEIWKESGLLKQAI